MLFRRSLILIWAVVGFALTADLNYNSQENPRNLIYKKIKKYDTVGVCV